MMVVSASAPAKVILFGEHAVVHGQPAIAIPVKTLRARVQARPAPQGQGLSIHVPAFRQRLSVPQEAAKDESTLVMAARLTLQRLGLHQLPDLTLRLDSNIPLGSGLGSGAAVCTAIARALAEALQQPLDNDSLNALVYEVEKLHHGTPSGIDNTVIVYEKPIVFQRGLAIEALRVAQPLLLLVGDTGRSTPTYITVGDVRSLHEKDPARTTPIFERIGALTRSARQLIEQGNSRAQLGRLMNENHSLLQRLTVSSVELDVLCEAALEAGALGAKLSGGGRGGNMLALVEPHNAEKVLQILKRAGAKRVVKTRLSPTHE